jgi:hypothetical protein
MSVNNRTNVSYGLSQALIDVSPAPIVSLRDPKTTDSAALGQMWINRTTGIAFILTSIVANVYTWYATAQAAASFTAAGALVAGTTLTVGTSAVIGTDLTLTAGNLLLTLGNATLTAGNLVITTGNATLGNGNLTISTATKGIVLPGGPKIVSGAGAPGVLVAPAGTIYSNYTNGKLYVMGAIAWELVTSV